VVVLHYNSTSLYFLSHFFLWYEIRSEFTVDYAVLTDVSSGVEAESVLPICWHISQCVVVTRPKGKGTLIFPQSGSILICQSYVSFSVFYLAHLEGHSVRGWARLCRTPDSLLSTHSLFLMIGQHRHHYDPQPVTEWVNEYQYLSSTVPSSDLYFFMFNMSKAPNYLDLNLLFLFNGMFYNK